MKEINAILTEEETVSLRFALGEFRRISRDQAKPRRDQAKPQSDKGYSEQMYEAACSLYEKLVETGNG